MKNFKALQTNVRIRSIQKLSNPICYFFSEYRITRVLTPSRPERRYVIAVPCDWRGDRTIWISKEFNSNVSIPVCVRRLTDFNKN